MLVVLFLYFSLFANRPETAVGATTNPSTAKTFVLPKSVPDPIEPLNRVMWDFNKGLMTDVIKPTSKVYWGFSDNSRMWASALLNKTDFCNWLPLDVR